MRNICSSWNNLLSVSNAECRILLSSMPKLICLLGRIFEDMSIALNVIGKHIEVIRGDNGWEAYYLGSEGKKRPANDIVVPSNIEQNELVDYIADLC